MAFPPVFTSTSALGGGGFFVEIDPDIESNHDSNGGSITSVAVTLQSMRLYGNSAPAGARLSCHPHWSSSGPAVAQRTHMHGSQVGLDHEFSMWHHSRLAVAYPGDGGSGGGGGALNIWSSGPVSCITVVVTDVDAANNYSAGWGGGLCLYVHGGSFSWVNVTASNVLATGNSVSGKMIASKSVSYFLSV
jgi:hypothetical protein